MKIQDHQILDVPYVESPNRAEDITPIFLVVHYTGSFEADGAIRHLCDARSDTPVSAHIVIDIDGAITQLVPFNVKAWHAGESCFRAPEGLYNGLNACSIGIELVNPGWFTRRSDGALLLEGKTATFAPGLLERIPHFIEAQHVDAGPVLWAAYAAAQIDAIEALTIVLLKTYRTLKYVVGHSDIAPDRKVDPGPAFPMERLRRIFAR